MLLGPNNKFFQKAVQEAHEKFRLQHNEDVLADEQWFNTLSIDEQIVWLEKQIAAMVKRLSLLSKLARNEQEQREFEWLNEMLSSNKDHRDLLKSKRKGPLKKLGRKKSVESRRLDEIFINKDRVFINRVYATLQDEEIDVIDDKLNYIGTNKSIIAVWLNVLYHKDFAFLEHLALNDKARILNNTFKNLNITPDNIRKSENTKTDRYFTPIFKQLLSSRSIKNK